MPLESDARDDGRAARLSLHDPAAWAFLKREQPKNDDAPPKKAAVPKQPQPQQRADRGSEIQ